MNHYHYVNPLMGAVANEAGGAGGGKTYPGAVVPFGMIQLSPDTVTGGDNGAGYSYAHSTIEGFSWIHLSGIGWYGEFGNLQTMPVSGERRFFSHTNRHTRKPVIGALGWESHYRHETEQAQAGYYRVFLDDCGVLAEATASRHTGALRFTFRNSGENHIVIDLHRRIGGHSDEQYLRVVDAQTLEGSVLCTPAGGGWGHGAGNVRYELHFTTRLSRPMKGWCFRNEGEVFERLPEMHGTSLGFCADYELNAEDVIEVHTAISFVDLAGAQNNFLIEDMPFDEMRQRARTAWEQALTLIDIEGGTERDAEIFYSCLYHTLLDPRDFSDCDGRYRADMRPPKQADGFTFRTVFSGWDVFRSAFPLYSLIRPDIMRDEICSLLEISRMNDDAPLARWEIAGIDSGCMVGDPAANVLCDAYMKDIGGFDAESAYAVCRRHRLGDRRSTGSLKDFNRLGYFPDDISQTIEYAFTDWCLSRMASKLGHADDAHALSERSLAYKLLYNAENGWLNRRDEHGNFLPFSSKYDERGCAESNVYQQIWFVPHDIDGLHALMGAERFERELDEFFEKTDFSAFWNDNYNHSNEPVHTIPHIFNQIGRPDKTQYWVRRIQQEAYRTGPYGYCGNEDVGQMSAWFVLTALGLHQSACASNRFEINTPLFPRAVLALRSDFHACGISDRLEIVTDRDPQTHPYIAGVTVNSQPVNRTYLTWEELTNGGTIRFSLSETPKPSP